MNSTLVLGLGNILMTDEGLGVHAVTELKNRYTFYPNIDIIDGGTAGLDLLPYIEGRENVLFIDAVNFKQPPGYVQLLQNAEIPSALQAKLSVHHIGIPDIIFALRFMGRLPKNIALIGMQPASMDSQIGLSDIVMSQMDKVIDLAIKKLQHWSIQCVLQSHQG